MTVSEKHCCAVKIVAVCSRLLCIDVLNVLILLSYFLPGRLVASIEGLTQIVFTTGVGPSIEMHCQSSQELAELLSAFLTNNCTMRKDGGSRLEWMKGTKG